MIANIGRRCRGVEQRLGIGVRVFRASAQICAVALLLGTGLWSASCGDGSPSVPEPAPPTPPPSPPLPTNRPPTGVGSIPDQTLTAGGSAVTVSFSSNFSDPDGDSLTFRAAADTSGVVRVVVDGSEVILIPEGVGAVTVTITATDPRGLSSVQRFRVTVAGPARAPATPIGFTVSGSGDDYIEWRWNAVGGAEGYEVQFSGDHEFTRGDPTYDVGAGLTYRQSDLEYDTRGYLRVRAYVGSGADRLRSDWTEATTGLTNPAPPPLTPLSWLNVPTEVVNVGVGETRVIILSLSSAIDATVRFFNVESQVLVEGVYLRPGVVQLTITGVGPGTSTIDLVAKAPGYESAEASFSVRVEANLSRRDFYVRAKDFVEALWVDVFLNDGRVYSPIRVFEGYGLFGGSSPCGPLEPGNALYCPSNAGVYYDTAFLDGFFDQIGDLAPGFIISHEIGHHVSHQLGWRPNVNMSIKQNEIQADCFGGVWVGAGVGFGFFDTRDVEEAVIALLSAGQPESDWFNPGVHGTTRQRELAFSAGFEQGPGICTDANWLRQFPLSATETLPYPLGHGTRDLDPPRR